jgi:hypothetical protein
MMKLCWYQFLLFLQVHYSLLYRHPEENGVKRTCEELGITLIAYSPLSQGFSPHTYTSPFSSPLFCENKNNSDLQRKNLMCFWCFLKVFYWHIASSLFILISWKKPIVVMLRGNLDWWCLLLSTGILSGKYTAANPPSGPRGRTFNAAFLAKVFFLSLHPFGFFHIAWYF